MTQIKNYLLIKSRDPRALWLFALGSSFFVSVFAAFRGGYIGPDYYTHFARLVGQSPIFDFAATSPPIYYLLGHGLFLLVGNADIFPTLLSIVQATTNALALWWFFAYTERRFSSRLIHLGLTFFLAFLPVRMIHASTIGTDSTTIPLFVLLLFLFDRFLSGEDFTVNNASFLGLGLALAKEFASRGCRIAICARDRAELEIATGQIGGNASAYVCDVTKQDEVNALIQATISGRSAATRAKISACARAQAEFQSSSPR